MSHDLLTTLIDLAWLTGKVMLFIVPLLLGVAYLTYAERKVLAWIQIRVGPNMVGPFGLLQPFADALKLMHKETIIPTSANPILFILAPVITFSLSIIAWAVIPFWQVKRSTIGFC